MYKGLRMQVLLLRGASANSGVEVHTMITNPIVAHLLESAVRDLVKGGFAHGYMGDKSEEYTQRQVKQVVDTSDYHQEFVCNNSGNLTQYCGWHSDKIQLLCRLIGGLRIVPCSMLINGFRVELDKVAEVYPSLS